MPEIQVHRGTQTDRVKFDRIYKIERGQEQQAVAAARKNGLDDVVFRMRNGDVFIASRRGVPGSVEVFDEVSFKDGVTYAGQRGEVMTIDNQRNTIAEAGKRGLGWGAVGLVGGTAGLFALSLKVLQGALGIKGIAIGGAIAGAVGLVAGLWSGRGKVDYEILHKYSRTVDGVSTQAMAAQPPKPAQA